MFFVLEGIDGSGKTTQTAWAERMLAEKYGAGAIVCTREPGGWEGGRAIREFVLDGGLSNRWSEFFYFMMDRCEHVERIIKPALSGGKIVLSDRYIPSTLAYQVFGDRNVTHEAADYMARLADVIGLPVPDAVFLLDIDIKTARARLESRGENDRFDERGTEFFERVLDGYEKVMASSSGRWIKIDASRGEDDVFTDLASNIARLLEARPA